MELIDIVDEKNKLTGQAEERKIVHDKCLWHRHVSSWIMNKNGEILLQRRSANKTRNPIEDYILQKEEVAEVKYVTIEEMEQIKKYNDLNYTFCKWDDEDFYREIEILKQKRKSILNKVY